MELVRRGLAPSRERAGTEIAAGRVTVGGAPADKASRLVGAGEAVAVAGPPARFVSRGGDKLVAAIDTFRVPVVGADALDAGASTGGFTDCLLQLGAASVTAVDVGRGQLDARLRADPRVTVVERTNLRHLTLEALGRPDRPYPLLTADLSFISLATVAPALTGLAGPGADMVVLVKPQFEAGRAAASLGRGVITDPGVWRTALAGVVGAFAATRTAMMGLMVSPLLGARGNVEFLAHLRAGGPVPAAHQGRLATAPAPDDATDDAIDVAVAAGIALRGAVRPREA
ncbi:MAG: TlyA family RNA methyltransferase [Acidimicrobiales bacterium]